jgi:hypothetical protein
MFRGSIHVVDRSHLKALGRGKPKQEDCASSHFIEDSDYPCNNFIIKMYIKIALTCPLECGGFFAGVKLHIPATTGLDLAACCPTPSQGIVAATEFGKELLLYSAPRTRGAFVKYTEFS